MRLPVQCWPPSSHVLTIIQTGHVSWFETLSVTSVYWPSKNIVLKYPNSSHPQAAMLQKTSVKHLRYLLNFISFLRSCSRCKIGQFQCQRWATCRRPRALPTVLFPPGALRHNDKVHRLWLQACRTLSEDSADYVWTPHTVRGGRVWNSWYMQPP